MKNKIPVFFLIMLLLSLSACSGKAAEASQSSFATESIFIVESSALSEETDKQEEKTESKILTAYFSWADNTASDDIDAMTSASVKNPGNVAQFAQLIENETGGDMFPIKVTDPYPADWDDCLDRANREKAEETLPALSGTVANIAEYDTVFLGYPNWWYSCPMAILSFIKENDLSGKNIYLFCSHGTGGLANSVQDITAALP